MSVIDIIGFVSSVIGIVQFGQSLFPPKDSVGSTVRITVGLDSAGGLDNGGGQVPGMALFNEAGGFLGQAQKNGKVTDGTTAELKVEQSSGQQATYGLFQAGNDAVCIAYVSITWPDGNQYAIPGDWGAACGGTWYYSNVYIQNSDYKPKCMWIDANGDQPKTGFQVHFPEFRSDSNAVPAGKDQNYFCNNKAPFQLFTTPWPQSIDYWNSDQKSTSQATIPSKKGRDVLNVRERSPIARRQAKGAAPALASQLVLTKAADHSAKTLCASKSSAGPDLVNLAEKMYCRMADKKTFPVCDGSATKDNCFNADSKQLIVGGKATREAYSLLLDWTVAGKSSPKKLDARKFDRLLDWTKTEAKAANDAEAAN